VHTVNNNDKNTNIYIRTGEKNTKEEAKEKKRCQQQQQQPAATHNDVIKQHQ